MEKIDIDGNTVIYLDHLILINKAYAKSCEESAEIYNLQQELFAFNPKKDDNKRKETCNETESNDDLLQLWQNLSEKCLKIIQAKGRLNAHLTPSITRYWEDLQEFPQFHGANKTKTFRKFTFNTTTNSNYIVPPNCTFFNHDLMQLTHLLPQLKTVNGYDLVVLDPPWRNKYIRRVKRARAASAYSMLDICDLKSLPLQQLLHENSLVAIWCTNSPNLQQALIEHLLPVWNLKLVHKLPWFKVNTAGFLISAIKEMGSGKQPFEMLFIATHKTNTEFQELQQKLSNVQMLLSVPSLVHSHKPPLLHWLQEYFITNQDDPYCLELFARYLQPHFTSIGLEVLKLMDERLYTKQIKDK